MDPTVKITPGVVRGASQSDTPGTWYEANLVRWVNGVARPVPGWEKILAAAPASTIRAVHNWVSNNGTRYTGILCEQHIYILQDGSLFDATPAGGMVGPASDLLAGGYGDFEYGYGEYGTERPPKEGATLIGPAWSINNWGETLLVMSSYDGRLLQWLPSTPTTKCVAVASAPVNNRMFVVTPQRHVMLFGMDADFRRFGWCSQENLNDWNFASTTNTAGEFFVEPSAPIVSATALKSGVLFTTTKKAYFVTYLGVPYVYGYDEIGESLTPQTAASVVSVSDRAIWWAENGFWSYESGSLAPIACPLLDWMKNISNPNYRRLRPFGQAIGNAPEVWWFFPTMDAIENDRYVSYNYVTGEWSMGKLPRTCGAPSSYVDYPMMSDGQSLYFHEKGNFYGDNPLPYLESASINLKSGGKISTISQTIPDHAGAPGSVLYTFFGRFTRVDPNSIGEFKKGPLSVRADGYLDVRMTARDFRMRIETAANGVPPWSFGEMITKIFQRGSR